MIYSSSSPCLITVAIIVLIFIFVGLYVAARRLCRQRREGEPPLVHEGSSLIWGNAAQFTRHAVRFLHDAQKVHGDVITLRLINQYLTIILDPHSYDAFCKEKQLNFEPIQKQVNLNVFGFVLKDSHVMLRNTGRTVAGRHLFTSMTQFVDNLNDACNRVLTITSTAENCVRRVSRTSGLRQVVSQTMFEAIFRTVFGDDVENDTTKTFHASTIYDSFEIFHKYFNYFWLGLPKCFFPSAARALTTMLAMPDSGELLGRSGLSTFISSAVNIMLKRGQTEADIKGHNLVYLHVNYNTFRLAFWTLAHLLQARAGYNALELEIYKMLENSYDAKTGSAKLTIEDVMGMKVLDSVVQETCRLASGVFVVRYVMEDTWFKTTNGKEFLLRKGDRAAIYPPAIHKDPEIFENAETFQYDRFINAKFYKNGRQLSHPVIAFGSLCPGRNYALLQLKWYLITMMTRFGMSLENPSTTVEYDYQYHGHEVLPPVSDVNVTFTSKATWPLLKLVDDKCRG